MSTPTPKGNRRDDLGQSSRCDDGRRPARWAIPLLAGLWLGCPARAEPPTPPALDRVEPPGVAAGGRERWTFAGRGLERVERVVVDGDGLSTEVASRAEGRLTADVRADPTSGPGFRDVRLLGPGGISNRLRVRVDALSQTAEREPNDRPEDATAIPPGSAGVGVLTPRDVDHFRFPARGGVPVVVDLEARRLGTPLQPVVSLSTAAGKLLTQRRGTPGLAGDVRFVFEPPADGDYLAQVKDNQYRGSEHAVYRLRVTTEPFATGLWPLGGPPGASLTVSLLGGNLDAPETRTVRLPDRPGATLDPSSEAGAFPFPFPFPGRLVTGDGPERDEPDRLEPGVTVNGRLERPGEVDRYRLGVGAGGAVRLAVVAAPLGSRLDAVLTVRRETGAALAENDDPPAGADSRETDSDLVFRPDADGEVVVEVADRYGRGGPEFAYRLKVQSPPADFSVTARPESDAINLEPGGRVEVAVGLRIIGRVGPIRLEAEGLPEGVTCAPVVVRPRSADDAPQRVAGRITLVASSQAPRGLGRLAIVASAEPDAGPELRREALFEPKPGNVGPAGTVPDRLDRVPVCVARP